MKIILGYFSDGKIKVNQVIQGWFDYVKMINQMQANFSFKSNLFLKVTKIQIDLKFKVQWRHLKINLIIIYYLI